MSHLSFDELDAVRDAALDAGLGDPRMRPILFRGVMRRYVAALPYLDQPGLQLQSDLMRMNEVERLIDGSVPLQIWLQNAVRETLQAEQARVFEEALDRVAARASGEPEPPAPDELPELNEEIILQDDTLPYGFLRLGWEAGAAVARLRVPPFADGRRATVGSQPAPPFLGTGWLVTDQLLMTNFHVVAARTAPDLDRLVERDLRLQGAATTAEFDYDSDERPAAPVECAELAAWDRSLDYAVLRLREPSGRRALSIAPAALRVGPQLNVAVNIIQHPMGEPKRVGLRNNLVTTSTDRDLRYLTDTRKGSSGSPVLDDGWQVVALHRASRRVDNVTFQGQRTAHVNVGTHIQTILAHLAERFPDVHREIVPAVASAQPAV
jgi:endonuclease G, mitochondrial